MNFEDSLPPRADPALRRFQQQWHDKIEEGRLPSRARIDVEALIAAEPRHALIGFYEERGRRRFAFVRHGSSHRRMIGRTILNMPLDQIVRPDVWPLVERTYMHICATRRAHYWQRTGAYVGGAMMTYERLLCPLAEDGTTVDSILGLWIWLGEGRDARQGNEPPT